MKTRVSSWFRGLKCNWCDHLTDTSLCGPSYTGGAVCPECGALRKGFTEVAIREIKQKTWYGWERLRLEEKM